MRTSFSKLALFVDEAAAMAVKLIFKLYGSAKPNVKLLPLFT